MKQKTKNITRQKLIGPTKSRPTTGEVQEPIDAIKRLNLTADDEKIYNKMIKLYNKLCSDDVTFNLFVCSPTTFKPFNFYRICDPSDTNRWNKAQENMYFLMYNFLCHVGYIKSLENSGYLTLTDKGSH
jgi:hypothetical protein